MLIVTSWWKRLSLSRQLKQTAWYVELVLNICNWFPPRKKHLCSAVELSLCTFGVISLSEVLSLTPDSLPSWRALDGCSRLVREKRSVEMTKCHLSWLVSDNHLCCNSKWVKGGCHWGSWAFLPIRVLLWRKAVTQRKHNSTAPKTLWEELTVVPEPRRVMGFLYLTTSVLIPLWRLWSAPPVVLESWGTKPQIPKTRLIHPNKRRGFRKGRTWWSFGCFLLPTALLQVRKVVFNCGCLVGIFRKHWCLSPTSEPLNQSLWGWSPGIYTLKLPRWFYSAGRMENHSLIRASQIVMCIQIIWESC